MKEAYDYCEALVRERDRERFLSALFAPAGKRPHLFALYAFDLEIAHVPNAVREPMAGEIRFQWWREAIAGERVEEAKANPVAAALLNTTKEQSLSEKSLIEMIDARRFDLLGEPMASREQLATYLDQVFGAIIGLTVKILAPSFENANAANFGGRAIGLTQILRDFARDAAGGRLFVPLDRLAIHEVHTASVLAGENSDGLRRTLAEMSETAAGCIDRLRSYDIPQAALPAFLPVAMTPIYLARLRRIRDPFRSSVVLSGLRSQFEIWRAARRGRI